MLGTMKRVMLFVLTNILVIAAVSFLIQLLGLKPYLDHNGIDYMSLLIFCGLFGFVGSFISLQISRWSAKRAMNIQLIDPEKPGSSGEREIVDMVRSLCTRNGLRALPEIGIYESPELNAFATGPSADRSLLAISSGLIARMDKNALDAVVGHEVAHIANGDMVTMTLVQGVVNTFVMFLSRVLAFFIENAMRGNRDDRRGGGLGFWGQYMLIQFLQTVLMLLASPLIYFYSRRREYAADASSAKTTGRENMIAALQTLKKYTDVQDNRAPSLSTFKINGRGSGLVALLYASHPPLDARIEALRNLR